MQYFYQIMYILFIKDLFSLELDNPYETWFFYQQFLFHIGLGEHFTSEAFKISKIALSVYQCFINIIWT
jgi:hypothetical protein